MDSKLIINQYAYSDQCDISDLKKNDYTAHNFLYYKYATAILFWFSLITPPSDSYGIHIADFVPQHKVTLIVQVLFKSGIVEFLSWKAIIMPSRENYPYLCFEIQKGNV